MNRGSKKQGSNSQQSNIKALVFDFGGVISKTLFETHHLTETALGLKPGTLTWRGPFDPASDDLWQAMQADQITEREYWLKRSAQVGALLGEQWRDMQTLVKRARGADPDRIVRPEVSALVLQAKQNGLRLALLSNELDLFYGEALRQRLTLLREFELIIDATHTEILKPDPRAYQACLDGLDLAPENCLMIDDQLRNVRGAQAIGMPAIEFDVMAPEKSCALIRAQCSLRLPIIS
jgi:putative hydrolase of the HAD superfamily